jgi:hypothetical protein
MELHTWVKMSNFDLLPIGCRERHTIVQFCSKHVAQPQLNFNILFKPEYFRLSVWKSGCKSSRRKRDKTLQTGGLFAFNADRISP